MKLGICLLHNTRQLSAHFSTSSIFHIQSEYQSPAFTLFIVTCQQLIIWRLSFWESRNSDLTTLVTGISSCVVDMHFTTPSTPSITLAVELGLLVFFIGKVWALVSHLVSFSVKVTHVSSIFAFSSYQDFHDYKERLYIPAGDCLFVLMTHSCFLKCFYYACYIHIHKLGGLGFFFRNLNKSLVILTQNIFFETWFHDFERRICDGCVRTTISWGCAALWLLFTSSYPRTGCIFVTGEYNDFRIQVLHHWIAVNYLPTIETIQEIFGFRLSSAFSMKSYFRLLSLGALLFIMSVGAQLGVQLVRELCNPQEKKMHLNFLMLEAFYLAVWSLLPWHQRRSRNVP